MWNRLKAILADFIQQADLVLLGLCCAATLYGMVLIASATRYMGADGIIRYVGVQGAAMALGLCAYVFMSMIDVEIVLKKWKWVLAFNIVFIGLLLTPLGVGGATTGNQAWLKIPGIPFQIGPAEIVKITFVLLLAKQPKAEETLGARRDGCSTILLAGTDKSGDRTDTVMLLSVDRSAKRLTLLSIPRDTKVNSTYTPHKINIAYGVNGKDQEGMEALMDYVTELVGFRPDGYVLIDLDVFVDLVDKMGGVKFDVPCDMDYSDPAQDLTIDLKAGMQRLNGEQAMGLVRFRSGYAMPICSA